MDEFTTLFILEASELQKEGFSIAVLHSPISVVSAYLLGGFSRSMFGGIDKIPPTVLEHAHQAYKGSRFEGEKNIYGEGDYQDISMAFPSEVAKLTSASPKNMDWHDVSEYLDKDGLKTILLKDAFYAFILCYVEPTEQFRFSPVTLRYSTPFGMRLAGLFGPQILWLTLPEYQLIVLNNLAKVQVLEGSLGIPTLPNMRLRGAMEKFQRLRDHEVIGRVVKGASQTIVGKMGSMWIDTVLGLTPDNQNLQYHLVEKTSPLFNLIYSCHVNGAIRAKITGLALKYGASSIRADGILVPVGTKIEEFSNNGMGGLKLKSSGKHLNPDDMLLEGPESTHLLDSIMSEKPNSETFLYPRRIIRTLRGELIRGKNFNNVGVVEYEFNRRRRLGSRKRIPTNKPTRQILLSEGIKHSPPKGKFGLIYIRREGGGYDYY